VEEERSKEFSFDEAKIEKGTDQIKAEKANTRTEMTALEFLLRAQKGEVNLMSAKEFTVHTMEMSGVERISEDNRWRDAQKRFGLFSNTLFGMDASIGEIHDFFEAGIINPEVTGRKMLFIIGPPGGGKTTLINSLASGMERNSSSLIRYKIKDCPTHESPLHLVPRFLRRGPSFDSVKAKKIGFDKPIEDILNIRDIVGDLCKPCRLKTLKEEHEGQWWKVLVEPHILSRQGGVGFGHFKPTKERSTDISVLCGRENLSVTNHPDMGYGHYKAWDLQTGEIPKSGGGLLHIIECLVGGIDTSVLRALLDLASDGYIRIEGAPFPLTWVDTVVVGDANLEGYKWFNGLKAEEALHDRIYPVFVPYTLRWGDELQIYQKFLLERDKRFSILCEGHIAPGALELAAKFAVIARYIPKSSIVGENLIGKMELYNGDRYSLSVAGDEEEDDELRLDDGSAGKIIDVEELLEEGWSDPDIARREGMFGPSPRMVLTALNQAAVRKMKNAEDEDGDGRGIHERVRDKHYKFCLTPRDVIQAIRDILLHQMGLSEEAIKRLLTFVEPAEKNSVVRVYKRFCLERVKRAFALTFGDEAKAYFNKYTKHCTRWTELHSPVLPEAMRSRGRRGDVLTGERDDVDEEFLRFIESNWRPPVGEASIHTHRSQMSFASARIHDFNYGTYKPLTDTCLRALLSGNEELLLTVISGESLEHKKDQNVAERSGKLKSLLLSNDEEVGGHCAICAHEITLDTRRFLKE